LDEVGNRVGILDVEPPVFHRDEKLVGLPVPAPAGLAFRSGFDPAEVRVAGQAVFLEIQHVLDPSSRSLGAPDLQPAGEAYTAVFDEVLHPQMFARLASVCNL